MKQNRKPRNKPTQLQPSDFDKGAKTYIGENTALSTNGAWKTGYLHDSFRRQKLDPYLSSCSKVNSKRIRDLNV
jgi:hypothetical protein